MQCETFGWVMVHSQPRRRECPSITTNRQEVQVMAGIHLFSKQQLAAVPEAGSGSYNPYLAARREWDERYGDQITRARNWRTMAVLCSVIAIVLAAGLIWQSSRSRVVPFIAVVDSFGRPIVSGVGDQTTTADERL